MAKELSIIIPAYNEARRLGRMLDQYLPYLQQQRKNQYEVLIVANGCTDNTEEIAATYARKYPSVRPIAEPEAIGKGGAIMLGMRKAEGNLIGFVDADGSTPPEAFLELTERIGTADAIIASRWLPLSRVSPRQPLKRRLISRLFNALVRALFGLRLTDTQCGAKLMKRAAALQALPQLGITRWAFDVDLLFQLRRAGCRIIEIPTTWHDVGGSQLQICKASLEMFVALVRLRLLYSPLRWIVSIYDRTLSPFIHKTP